MRVLHLDMGKEMRGGQWQALRLIEGLGAEGVESTLLARGNSPLLAHGAEPLNLFRLARLARRHDLVHAHDARSHTLAALAGGAPLVVSRRVAFAPVSRWKYRRAARFIAVSEFVKSTLVKHGIPPERIAVVYDGVPLRSNVGPPGTRALALATSDPQKGSALAAQAARIAGVDLHFSSNLERDLPSASLFVYITHSEGLGSAALLAMSAGVAVIASKIGGLPEIVRHRENGLLVHNDPHDIAAAIRELAADPALAARLAAAGLRTVEERFTVAHMVRRTMEVYRQALA